MMSEQTTQAQSEPREPRQLSWKTMQQVKPARQYQELILPSPYPNDPAMAGQFAVRIRKMFTAEWLAFVNARTDDNGIPIRDRMERDGELQVEFCWVDQDGRRQMDDGDTNTEWWRKSDPAFSTALIASVREFNRDGMIDLEAARKNWQTAPGSSDTGGLPLTSENPVSPNSLTESAGTSS
jgi:hypothetical protein